MEWFTVKTKNNLTMTYINAYDKKKRKGAQVVPNNLARLERIELGTFKNAKIIRYQVTKYVKGKAQNTYRQIYSGQDKKGSATPLSLRKFF